MCSVLNLFVIYFRIYIIFFFFPFAGQPKTDGGLPNAPLVLALGGKVTVASDYSANQEIRY